MVDSGEIFTDRVLPSPLGCEDDLILATALALGRLREVLWLHIDVIDGQFAPADGLPLSLMGRLREAFQKNAIPPPQFDVHLMVCSPAAHIQSAVGAGANRITLHCECAPAELDGAIGQLRSRQIPFGLAINPSTAVEKCGPYLSAVHFLLCMGVTPGLGGQPLLPSALDNIRRAAAIRRAGGFRFPIGVDGGINGKTLSTTAACGADFFISGSAIFGADDPVAAWDELNGLARRICKSSRPY